MNNNKMQKIKLNVITETLLLVTGERNYNFHNVTFLFKKNHTKY